MNDAGQQDVVAAFASRGYAVVPAALERATVHAALSAVTPIERSLDDLPDDVVQRWFVLEPRVVGAQATKGSRGGRQAFIVGDPVRFRPELARILTDPSCVQLAGLLLGATTIRYHFGNLTTKQPQSTRTIGWHRDFPNQYMCPRRASFVRVMMCLDGMDDANGATRFVPGSHLVSDEEAIAAEQDGSVDVPDAGVEVATCPPGSLVLIHPKVVHGGPANTSSRPRRNLIVQWGLADEPVCVYDDIESLTGLTVETDRAAMR